MDEFNNSDEPTILGHCLHRLVEHAATRYTDSIALICAETQVSFGEVNTRANGFARILAKRGVGPGDLVGVAMDRSVDLVAMLLGVLKAGAAYVPIDTALPVERITQILNNADPKLVIIDSAALGNALSPWKDVCLAVDEARDGAGGDAGNLDVDVCAEDLAYVIYTSGTTGKPKGVEICHGAVSNLLCSMKREPGCSKTDRLLAVTTISFDIAVLELFLPLLCGATTIVARAHEVRDASALLGLIDRHAVTVMQGTPSTWQLLLDSGWQGKPCLGKILCGGEALPRRLAESLLDCADSVWNMYGPTETTVWSSVWRVRLGEDVVIGKPIANTQLYVLGADLSPAPLGSPGELCIGGAGVARGYHKNPELTRSRFVENPFRAGPGALYRTGDVACFVAPGKLRVLGRTDDQVKVRGHRIELGDIEAAITDHGDISKAVVVCRDERLVAYCVPVVGHPAQDGLGRLLRPWLAERLPAYMVPALFVQINEIPITVNGKVNRQALPDPVSEMQATAEPATELERHILAIWADVLGHGRIGIEDNFFQIGGDSLRLVCVQRELEKLLNRPVLSAKLFEHYTMKSLAAYLANTDKTGQGLIPGRNRAPYDQDIAVISTACRLPGGVTTPEEFWQLLASGGDATTDVPEGRWDADALYDTESGSKSYCRRGGFVRSSINAFDAPLFGISPREKQSLDPTQCMMLEVCWDGFERAGYTSEQMRGSPTGVFIGVSNFPAYDGHTHSRTDLDGYAGTGSAAATLSGRISYTLGLEGPAMTVDTACSSSLVTTHLACTSLRQGECDIAVSGGVTLMLGPGLHIEFGRLRAMSPDGRCRAFSGDTEGTGWGEGAAAVVLKRLSDARRDGDPILAVLRGTAVNHGGRGASLTTPSCPAQKRLIYAALASSGLQPGDIDYIEAHGTGTKLGDPIEGAALAEVFGGSRPKSDSEPLWIGSAKSNIGHTQAAAGLVGMLKVILALQNGMLPRTLHVAEPTPAVDWTGANMALVQREQPWLPRERRPRRAGVSAFGIGGTNAHVIVEEPPRQAVEARRTAPLPPTVPFLLSGHTETALSQQAEKLRRHMGSSATDQDRLGHVAYSLATTRNHFRHRLVLMARDKADLLEKLASAAKCPRRLLPASNMAMNHAGVPQLAMLFTGQGSHHLGIGRNLCRVYPLFRESLDEIAAHFTELEQPLLEVMWADPGSPAAALLDRTDFAQPALFALQVALWRLWQSWGVQPRAVLGHSVGELAAAHIAGVVDLPGACRLVAARGRLMRALPGGGRMISLEASVAQVTAAMEALGLAGGKVDIASRNTPTQTVISGDADAAESLAAHFAAEGHKTKTLNVSHAFHSHHVDGMLAAFQAVAETVRFSPPTTHVAVVSGLTGKLAETGQLQRPEYWVRQARGAVRFSDGIQTLADHLGVSVFLELGPRPVLCGLGAACLGHSNKPSAWVPSLIPGKDGASVMQGSLAELHVRLVPVSWPGYFEPFGCRRVELPTYAFQREPLRPDVGPPSPDTGAQLNGTSPVLPGGGLRQALSDGSPEQGAAIALELVREIATETLGFASPADVDVDQPLQDLGIDSMTAALLHNRLAGLAGFTLPAGTVSDHPNLRALSHFLLSRLETDTSTDSASSSTVGTSPSDVSAGLDEALPAGCSSVAIATSQSADVRRLPDMSDKPSIAIPPLNHVILAWCSPLLHDFSPTSGILPGYGQAIAFISQCFIPANQQRDQFFGCTLAHSHGNTATNGVENMATCSDACSRTPPLRHMLSLFRPSDPSHLKDPSRPILRVATLFALGGGTSGYEGILHGGLTATLLDESLSVVNELNTALGKTACLFAGISVTASLNVRFLAPVATTEAAVCVTTWVEGMQGLKTILKGEMTNSKGSKLADAESVFVAVGPKT